MDDLTSSGRQTSDAHLLSTLRTETLSTLGQVINTTSPVALLDVPNQRNVGDSLILAGEIRYLNQLGCDIRYVADIFSYDVTNLRSLMPRGTVLLHGGGNFGDIWPGHQKHREQIVADLRDYTVVQLSQSIFFESNAAASRANATLASHPDFTVLLRDRDSIARASRQLPDLTTLFCHDMALGWGPRTTRRHRLHSNRVLVLARADKEAASGLADLSEDSVPGAEILKRDWRTNGLLEIAWTLARGTCTVIRRLQRLRRTPRLVRRTLNAALWTNLRIITLINIMGGTKMFTGVRVAVVDRLHAHVLSVLLGVDNIVLDNNYGKIAGVWAASTGQFSIAQRAEDTNHAAAMLSEKLS